MPVNVPFTLKESTIYFKGESSKLLTSPKHVQKVDSKGSLLVPIVIAGACKSSDRLIYIIMIRGSLNFILGVSSRVTQSQQGLEVRINVERPREIHTAVAANRACQLP